MTTRRIGHEHERLIHRAQLAALQRFGIKVAIEVDPEDEPIALADAYVHLRADSTSSAWLAGQIPAAREYCERYLGRALAPRTLELATNRFPTVAIETPPGPCVDLPFGPVRSIESVSYLDGNGDEQQFEDSSAEPLYALDDYVTPNRLVLKYGAAWPPARDSLNSVKVRYVVGYAKAADSNGWPVLPWTARSAILLMLGHLYENREAVTEKTSMVELPLGARAYLDLTPDHETLGVA